MDGDRRGRHRPGSAEPAGRHRSPAQAEPWSSSSTPSAEFPRRPNRIYASTVSYGSTLAWAALATYPGLFDGALITGGFAASAAQATAIAASDTPVWITHGTHDHLLNVVTTGQASYNRIWNAYMALGKTPPRRTRMVKYTEYADSAFYEPDRHLAAAPTYEDKTILQWLLAQ